MENLSQEEIDALLEEASEEEAATEAAAGASEEDEQSSVFDTGERPVRSFDFNVPTNSISRALERNLRGICESFAKDSSLSFSNLIRTTCDFTYESAEIQSFGETLSSFENPCCLALCTMEPLSGSVLVHADASIMFAFFTKLLGGPLEQPGQIRDFTEIEMGMTERVLERVLESFGEASEKLHRLHPKLEQIENNPNYLNAFSEGEAVVNLRFSILTEEIPGRITFVIPKVAFEPVKDVFDPKEGLDVRSPGDRQRERNRAESLLHDAEAEVAVRFQPQPVAMKQLLEMGVGDTLELNHHVSRPIDVFVEGKALFHGHSGQFGRSHAVRIVGRKKEK